MLSGLRGRTAVWLTLSILPILAIAIVALTRDDAGGIRTVIIVGCVATAGFLVLGWAALYLPFFQRIERIRAAADQFATGQDTERLDDRVPDEVGAMANAIDRLADQRDNVRRSAGEIEERHRFQTSHDNLTGLLNRQAMVTQLETNLGADDGRTVSIVFVDFDDFRLVNELFGHNVGDQVLVAAGNRLRRLVGDDIALGRWSADEFVIVIPNAQPEALQSLATRIRALFDEPMNTTAGPHPLAVSVGSASVAAGSGTVDELLHDADVMVESEKQAHRRARAVSPETARLVELALADNRLEVWYQPIVAMSSATETRMIGAEAFVRLRADDNSLRVPSDFLAEIMTSRYARQIDQRMAAMVLVDLAGWQAEGVVGSDFFVSLNLSPASLRDSDLGRSLVDLCQERGVGPNTIVLDLSEEAGELDQIIAAELRHSGFRLSIDDLGLKRSNFDRLFNIGAEFAKLHRRWLDDEIMLDALVNICQRKGLHVVAEGVETMPQLELLFSRGVRLCQGYVISRPISAPDFHELLRAGRATPAATTTTTF